MQTLTDRIPSSEHCTAGPTRRRCCPSPESLERRTAELLATLVDPGAALVLDADEDEGVEEIGERFDGRDANDQERSRP